MKTCVRQGCVLSPLLFNCVMDRILKEATDLLRGGLQIQYTLAGGLFLSYWSITTDSTCIQNLRCCRDQERATALAGCCRQSLCPVGHADQCEQNQDPCILRANHGQMNNKPAIHHTAGTSTGGSRLFIILAVRWDRVPK